MPQFNATDAMFYGFRLFQRDPILIGVLSLLMAVFSLVMTQLTWTELAAFTGAMYAIQEGAPGGDPDAMMQTLRDAYLGLLTSPSMIGFFLLNIAVSVVIQGAVLRSLIFEQRGGWVLGMQLGMDELRIFVVGLVIGLGLFLMWFAASIVIGLIGGLLSVVAGPLGAVVIVLGFFGAAFAITLVSVRFCAAAPASVGEQKFVVLGSWTMTRGHMWGLLGAFVVLFFIAILAFLVVAALNAVLAGGAAAVLEGRAAAEGIDNPASVFLSPGYILSTVLSSVVNVGLAAAFSGVGAYAYLKLGRSSGQAVAESFS
ncbi:MAG: hypothetical protein PVI23_06420 [Maricaulaceae bacterium]|jgi:hypothetical protein